MRKMLLVMLLLAPLVIHGQTERRVRLSGLRSSSREASNFTVGRGPLRLKRYLHIQAGVGGAAYFGDLAPSTQRGSTYLGYTRPAAGVSCLFPVHHYIGIRGSLAWSRLRGDDYAVSRRAEPTADDIGRFTRNLGFRNDILELSVAGVFELFPSPRDIRRRGYVRPYATLGISLFRHDPRAEAPGSGKWVRLRPLGTEGQWTGLPGTPRPYCLVQPALPLGMGVRYRLADRWDLQLEVCYRFTLTDALDDVSGAYPSDSVYAAMVRSGNLLGVALSNRSAEGPRSGAPDRQAAYRGWRMAPPPLERVPLPGGVVMERVRGTSAGGAPRGRSRPDRWIVSGVSLSYALQAPGPRRRPR